MPALVIQEKLETTCVSWSKVLCIYCLNLPTFKIGLVFYNSLSSRWNLIYGRSLCILLCEGLSDLLGTLMFGTHSFGGSLHYTFQPCCLQFMCWQMQHSSISSAVGLRILDALGHPAGQLCLLRVILGIR